MNKYIKIHVIILFFNIGLFNIGYAQAIYNIQDTRGVHLKLKGTSTLHDWEMVSNYATGEAQFITRSGSPSELTSLKSLSFVVKVKDLQSDNKGLNNNAYTALKSDEYKDIHYKLSSSTLVPEKGGYLLKTKGKLTIAGITKDIVMDVHSVINANGTITCKGSYNLKMTDYQVKPPSFMMGMMKTGDVATVDFTIDYK